MNFDKAIRSPNDIGPLLRALRTQHKLTQQDLSKFTGIKQQTISAIENGQQKPELSTLFAILSYLNLELVVRLREQRSHGFAPGRAK